MAVIFFGTLDQVDYGIYTVQKRYFESWLTYWQYPEQWIGGSSLSWLKIPLLGGYSLGILLLLNLLCAHLKYYKFITKKAGIILIHFGLMLLIIGGFLTDFYQEESQMWLDIGQTNNYSENYQENEFVILKKSQSTTHQILNTTAIDINTITPNNIIDLSPHLPFKIRFLDYYPNSEIGFISKNPTAPKSIATQGAAIKMGFAIWPKPTSYKPNDINTTSAHIEILSQNNQSLGIWLVSNLFDSRFPPQTIDYNGHSYEIALRFKRTYFPFSLQLTQFTHEIYPGTDIPKNFQSTVLIRQKNVPDRNVLIYMNHPLRYNNYTFYQASFGNNDQSSMFQVVKNPSRLFPYISVAIVSFGLLFQFISSLLQHLFKKKSSL